MAKEEKKNLQVERETYESKTKEERFNYFVRGTLRGKEIKASLMPSDIGGYDLLDILFIGNKTADLIVSPFEMKNEETGEMIKGNTYIVRVIDEKGDIYECPVKPRQKSDKCILEMFLARL